MFELEDPITGLDWAMTQIWELSPSADRHVAPSICFSKCSQRAGGMSEFTHMSSGKSRVAHTHTPSHPAARLHGQLHIQQVLLQLTQEPALSELVSNSWLTVTCYCLRQRERSWNDSQTGHLITATQCDDGQQQGKQTQPKTSQQLLQTSVHMKNVKWGRQIMWLHILQTSLKTVICHSLFNDSLMMVNTCLIPSVW